MSTEEVIEKLEEMYRSDNPVMYGKRGTIKAAVDILEKTIEKKPHIERCTDYIRYSCPSCKKHFRTECRGRIIGYSRKYCEECGQKLDWSECNEENRNMSDVL